MARVVRVQPLTNQAEIADKCLVATRFFDRLKGFVGRREIAPGEAILFPRNNSVHMWMMSVPIDVVFLKREGERLRVTSVRESIRPWRLLPVGDLKASDTLELAAGTVARLSIRAGDELTCSS